jgi:hypothetical protein
MLGFQNSLCVHALVPFAQRTKPRVALQLLMQRRP